MTKHGKPGLGPSRRSVLKGSLMTASLAGVGVFYGPWEHNRAFAQGKKPIKLGLTNDASGQFGNSGQDDHRAIRMVIDEWNARGGVLGRKIEWVTADTESSPATGTRIAERFITREDCPILIGALHSGVANAITQVANKYGTIYLNTNSSAPSEAAENCSRIKFVWDGNGTNFTKAAVKNAVRSIGKNWLLLTNDYVYGHSTAAATKREVEAAGGRIMDNLLVPQNTRDFTSYLLKVQQLKPDVVATAMGGDDNKALREQIAQLKLDEGGKPAWINNQQDWPDVWVRRKACSACSARPGTTSSTCRVSPSSSRSGRQRTKAARSPCRATCPTTATWRRRSSSVRWSGPARPTTSRSSRPWKGTRCRPKTACSITMPTSIPSHIRCSRPSILPAKTASRATTPTTSKS